MRNTIWLYVSANDETRSWIYAKPLEKRGREIQRKAIPHLQLQVCGVNSRSSESFKLKEVAIRFVYNDDGELARQEFQRIAPLIQLPSPSRLVEFRYRSNDPMDVECITLCHW